MCRDHSEGWVDGNMLRFFQIVRMSSVFLGAEKKGHKRLETVAKRRNVVEAIYSYDFLLFGLR